MGKILVEVCLISARGLLRTAALWKLQWYAVGWIDPNSKYCTKIDASGNANPVWKTKFSSLIDSSDTNFNDLALNVEVYSREPLFLRERLLGTATVVLKEFLAKYLKNSEVKRPVEEVGSFQLRKKNSNRPQGFVDLSVQISEEMEEPSSYTRDQEGIRLMDHSNSNNLHDEYGVPQTNLPQLPKGPPQQLEIHPQEANQYGHIRPVPLTAGPSYAPAGAGPSYRRGNGMSLQPPRAPPPALPPPSNVGYVPTLLPQTNNVAPSYINLPSSGAVPRHGSGPGFGMGLGAGALAAGTMMFGDNFMSGFDVPRGLQDASLTISIDPPF